MQLSVGFTHSEIALNAHTIIFNSVLVAKRFTYALPRTATAFVIDAPLIQSESKVARAHAERFANVLKRIQIFGVFVRDPSFGIVKEIAASATLRAEIFLKALDSIRQDRKHQPFFGPPMTLLAKHICKLIGR
ncbi:MAG: hypothetical protein ACREQO_08675 [Candidatus Binatia bacterium]